MTNDYDIPAVSTQGRWHTSSYSGGQGNCVQAALGGRGTVPVRDSKQSAGPVLDFSREAWTAFLDQLR